MGLAATILAVFVSYWIYASKFGTGLFAIHDDEDVAEVMGVPTYRFKLDGALRHRRHPFGHGRGAALQ